MIFFLDYTVHYVFAVIDFSMPSWYLDTNGAIEKMSAQKENITKITFTKNNNKRKHECTQGILYYWQV